MKYCTVKLKWSEPKEGTDQMQKKTKRLLVRADSVSEAEGRMLGWVPGNYQDPEVKGVDESDIVGIHKQDESETWWFITLSDENDKGKFVPFNIAINGNQELEVLKNVVTTLYRTSQFESMKRFKVIVDDDLLSEEIPNKTKVSEVSPFDQAVAEQENED